GLRGTVGAALQPRDPARRVAHEGGRRLDLLLDQVREDVVEVEEQRRPYRVVPCHPPCAPDRRGGDTKGRRPPRRGRRGGRSVPATQESPPPSSSTQTRTPAGLGGRRTWPLAASSAKVSPASPRMLVSTRRSPSAASKSAMRSPRSVMCRKTKRSAPAPP